MNEFLYNVLNSSDEELIKIVNERANMLELNSLFERKIIAPNERLYDYQSYYLGFIKKDVKIYFSMGAADSGCYTLGNYDYLVDFFKIIRDRKISKNSDILKHLSSLMDEYFGQYCGTDKREKYIISMGEYTTIDSFKGKSMAACSERAAVSNNILEMLGIRSIFVTGLVNGQQHAFNIVIDNNDCYFVLDTAYNCCLYDSNNNVLGTVSYMHGLGKMNEDLERFLFESKEFSFADGFARKNNDGLIGFVKNGRLRKYEIEPIKLEEEKKRIR